LHTYLVVVTGCGGLSWWQLAESEHTFLIVVKVNVGVTRVVTDGDALGFELVDCPMTVELLEGGGLERELVSV
jgi:hypothetical protein